MRVIEVKLYSFDELNDKAKEKAIEKVRESYYKYNDFAEWAVDDCYLLQPKELMNEDLLIKNNRKIYFSLDRGRYIDVSSAMEIVSSVKFLKWLGLDNRLINKVDYFILKDSIEFHNQSENKFTKKQEEKLEIAISKFEDHCNKILERIENDIDYRFSDESIIEQIECNGYEFTEDGSIY